MTSESLPPPGWYVDPANSGLWRWWSGESWTSYTSQRVVRSLDPNNLEAEERIARFACWAIFVNAFAAVVMGFIGLSHTSQLAHWLHLVRVSFDYSSNAVAPPPTPGYLVWQSLVSLPVLAAEIIFLIWQYRAAMVAKGLGFPARHSPGWGVASWFVPIVQVWMPYQAVRDLLPLEHPTRRKLAYWWGLGIFGLLANGSATFVAAYDRPIGVVVMIVGVVSTFTVAYLSRTIVLSVVQSHRSASDLAIGSHHS